MVLLDLFGPSSLVCGRPLFVPGEYVGGKLPRASLSVWCGSILVEPPFVTARGRAIGDLTKVAKSTCVYSNDCPMSIVYSILRLDWCERWNYKGGKDTAVFTLLQEQSIPGLECSWHTVTTKKIGLFGKNETYCWVDMPQPPFVI